jgi:hypothetical protein
MISALRLKLSGHGKLVTEQLADKVVVATDLVSVDTYVTTVACAERGMAAFVDLQQRTAAYSSSSSSSSSPARERRMHEKIQKASTDHAGHVVKLFQG